MATVAHVRIERREGDTVDEIAAFWVAGERDVNGDPVPFALTGRTFAGHIKRGSAEVIAFTDLVPYGDDDNLLALSPTVGAWTDLVAGDALAVWLWETTNGMVSTFVEGSVVVMPR